MRRGVEWFGRSGFGMVKPVVETGEERLGLDGDGMARHGVVWRNRFIENGCGVVRSGMVCSGRVR